MEVFFRFLPPFIVHESERVHVPATGFPCVHKVYVVGPFLRGEVSEDGVLRVSVYDDTNFTNSEREPYFLQTQKKEFSVP